MDALSRVEALARKPWDECALAGIPIRLNAAFMVFSIRGFAALLTAGNTLPDGPACRGNWIVFNNTVGRTIIAALGIHLDRSAWRSWCPVL